MIFNNHKAYTLVEMLVALAVSAIIIAATYASYEMVATQYHKNMDIANMHTSGRAIMRIIERDVRMAGFEYRDKDAKITYGSISNPLTIKDSGNKCCDEVTVIYDYFDEESKKAERIRIRYWAEPHTSNKGSRHRLYKQKDILGRNGSILTNPALGRKEVMADYIEDLQISNTSGNSYLYVTSQDQSIEVYDLTERKFLKKIGCGYRGHSLTFGPDGLLYGQVWKNYDRVICITDPKTGKDLGTMGKGLNGGVAFGPDGFLYAASAQSGVHVYNPKTKKLVRTISINGTSNSALTFGPDGFLYVVHHGSGQYTRKINPNSGKIVGGFNTNRGGSYITGLAFNSSGFIFDSRYSADRIGSYDPSTGNLGVSIGSQRAYCGFTFGPGNLLYAVGKYGGVEIFDVVANKKVGDLKKNNGSRNIFCGVTTESNIKTSALVTINLTLRTKNQYGKDRQFKKQDYHAGNFKIDKTDKYKRDTFSTTVLVRNLAL
jgi:prepilin-type N-terminal cleavage/methylation domain-containing protein